MEPRIDFLAVDHHELLVAGRVHRELRMLSLNQDAALVAMGRVEQSKIDLAAKPRVQAARRTRAGLSRLMAGRSGIPGSLAAGAARSLGIPRPLSTIRLGKCGFKLRARARVQPPRMRASH